MDNFYEILDDVETKIEEHRSAAFRMVEDRKNFETVLLTVKKSSEESQELTDIDKEEIQLVLDRLGQRLSTVNVSLVTHRNESQVEALQKVNEKIEDLVVMIECNSPEAKQTAETYLNACSKGNGSRFEALLLSCTSDDQKAVKVRIENIVDNLKALSEPDSEDQQQPSCDE